MPAFIFSHNIGVVQDLIRDHDTDIPWHCNVHYCVISNLAAELPGNLPLNPN